MVINYEFGFVLNFFRHIKSWIMGDSIIEKSEMVSACDIKVPPISKLGDAHGYWVWRMLLKSYLEAIGLWSGNLPKECAKTKFILLSTLEIWVLKREYEDLTCTLILEDLKDRYTIKGKASVDSFL
ncbi:hypothetical protein KR009_010275 [Drosophila setifemur]|nr:hypothetical protein KR009_010275 [Drosophila setifemur]